MPIPVEERLATLEQEMKELKSHLTKHEQLSKDMDGKLDDLLIFRAKGVGAFWLASSVLGTSIVATLVTIWGWVKGVA